MGTKNKPDTGLFDSYGMADPDEPMFVLLGRDPIAPLLITMWRAIRMKMDDNSNPALELLLMEHARLCSVDMEKWARSHGQDPDKALKVWSDILRQIGKSLGKDA